MIRSKEWKEIIKRREDYIKKTSGLSPYATKYHNEKIIYGGIKFDSKKECERYKILKSNEEKGIITNLELQKKFELQPSYKIKGKTIRSLNYIADFYYYCNDTKEWIVEDVKGYKTEIYKLKKKIFEYKYKIEIREI